MVDESDRATVARDAWPQRLAALPMESPPPDAWARLSRELDTPQPIVRARPWRPRRAAWPAMAAAVTAMAVIPFINGWIERPAPLSPSAPVVALPPERSATVVAAAVADGDASSTALPTAVQSADSSAPYRQTSDQRAARSSITVAAPRDRQTASGPANRKPAADTRLPQVSTPNRPGRAVAASAEVPSDPLQPLYAEAARLEALVALTRDDRVASASGAVLTDELGARIGVIDALLAQPGLSPDERAALWHRRVATLRQLAGVESTERWLAAHGEAYGDALVRVH